MRRLVPIAAVLLLAPSTAQAANSLHPRTPANFGDVPCMTTVDAGSVAHFEYTVPFDELTLTADELPDSRTMQFFALHKMPFDYGAGMPVYITQSDYDRAEANGDNQKDYFADDILETASDWPKSQWIAITPSDMRVPITSEQAAMGVDWDTTGAAAGGWMIAGYTFEPDQNLWSFRLGAVRVVDPANPDAAGPAAYFDVGLQGDPPASVGDMHTAPACIDAGPGATYTASLGIIEGVDEPMWMPFVEDEPVGGKSVNLKFEIPPEAAGLSVKLRLEVTDAAGNKFVAFSPFPLTVVGQAGDAGSSGDSGDGGGSKSGCQCSAGEHRRDPAWWLAILITGTALQRRRRHPVRRWRRSCRSAPSKPSRRRTDTRKLLRS